MRELTELYAVTVSYMALAMYVLCAYVLPLTAIALILGTLIRAAVGLVKRIITPDAHDPRQATR